MRHRPGKRYGFARGAWVEVRSEEEIRATLDAGGQLDGLPFMPEMTAFCGRALRVFRRAEKVFLDREGYVARLSDTVFLDGARCSGDAHGGCQMGCLLFWKEAWLKPARSGAGWSNGEPAASAAVGQGQEAGDEVRAVRRPMVHCLSSETAGSACAVLAEAGQCEEGSAGSGRFACQATELIRAATPLPWWDLWQYVRDLSAREIGPGQFARMFWRLACDKFRRACGLGDVGAVRGREEGTAHVGLGLRPGEWVEVRSREEIEATLDRQGRTQGLAFGPEMLPCCGKRYRVARRVERLIVEWSGELRPIRNTVALEGATCDGLLRRFCPRDCYYLWREAWLKRVPQGGATTAPRRSCANQRPDHAGESP
jgi:hypothetical protein